MTNIAPRRGVVLSVATDATRHFQRAFHRQHIFRPHIAMAGCALGFVPGVTEENEVRQLVNAPRRNLPIAHLRMAHVALL